VRGTRASEVTWMSHASFVPMRAEPRNRTLLRGVRKSLG
jgi:hypothetical protein